MGKKTRTEITVESLRRTAIRRRGRPRDIWCQECASEVPMLTPDEAAAALGTTARAIYRRVERGALHFSETGGGALLVCTRSLYLEPEER